jgi:heme/copper-type cytochrome/quinol oxidase subunit 3
MSVLVIVYATLILVSVLSTAYTLYAYHMCPSNRSHRPLILPIVCSIAWFLVSVDQLVAMMHQAHGTMDGLTMVMLITVTLAALLYFVQHYVQGRSLSCAIHHSER